MNFFLRPRWQQTTSFKFQCRDFTLQLQAIFLSFFAKLIKLGSYHIIINVRPTSEIIVAKWGMETNDDHIIKSSLQFSYTGSARNYNSTYIKTQSQGLRINKPFFLTDL
jgi:hypothetical protein